MTALIDKLKSMLAETERATPEKEWGDQLKIVLAKMCATGERYSLEQNVIDREFVVLARTQLPAALRALVKAVERLNKIELHQPDSTDKVVLLVNIQGYRDCAKEALAEIEKEFQ